MQFEEIYQYKSYWLRIKLRRDSMGHIHQTTWHHSSTLKMEAAFFSREFMPINQTIWHQYSTLKMEAADFSRDLMPIRQTTWHHSSTLKIEAALFPRKLMPILQITLHHFSTLKMEAEFFYNANGGSMLLGKLVPINHTTFY
jgi:hypothetical protein